MKMVQSMTSLQRGPWRCTSPASPSANWSANPAFGEVSEASRQPISGVMGSSGGCQRVTAQWIGSEGMTFEALVRESSRRPVQDARRIIAAEA
jgi:hypothetical protein